MQQLPRLHAERGEGWLEDWQATTATCMQQYTDLAAILKVLKAKHGDLPACVDRCRAVKRTK